MNTPWSSSEWRRVLVYGLGLSGVAATRLLRAHDVAVVAVDRLGEEELNLGQLPGDAAIEWRLGEEPSEVPAGVDGIVVSPGVPLDRPLLRDARAKGLTVIGEVDLAALFLTAPVAAITGSNGKSTTTALAARMLQESGKKAVACGNIGRPLSSCVVDDKESIFVVELSSFQTETLQLLRPRVGALLNISPDHLDRHRDLDGYAAAKRALFARQGRGDVAILNADDRLAAATEVRGRCRHFSRRIEVADGCFLDEDRVLEKAPGEEVLELFRPEDVSLAGSHNLENAMAAALIARAFGVQPEDIREALRSFQTLPHRMEEIRRRSGVVWIDDSKGTNVAATLRSLEGFADHQVHLILGGRKKDKDVSALTEIVRRKAKYLYLVGESADFFAQALNGVVPFEVAGTVRRAVALAAERARADEVVLLSPACASFDQFENFSARGDHFQQLVRELPEGVDG